MLLPSTATVFFVSGCSVIGTALTICADWRACRATALSANGRLLLTRQWMGNGVGSSHCPNETAVPHYGFQKCPCPLRFPTCGSAPSFATGLLTGSGGRGGGPR